MLSGIQGMVYAPTAQVSLSGNGQLKSTLIVDTLRMSGNAVAMLSGTTGGHALLSPTSSVMVPSLMTKQQGARKDMSRQSETAQDEAQVLRGTAEMNGIVERSDRDFLIGGLRSDRLAGQKKQKLAADEFTGGNWQEAAFDAALLALLDEFD